MKATTTPEPRPLAGQGPQPDELELGYVSGIFGVQGEVRLFLHNRGTPLFGEPRRVVLIDPEGRRFEASLQARPGAGKRVLGQIAGVETREDAESWMGWRLYLPREDLPTLEDGEFYYWQVEGLPVFLEGEEVGVVLGVHPTAGGEVFEVRVHGEPLFVPANEHALTLDLQAGRVELRPEALE